eukprot:8239313-Alexandrium_andersonii.AAC.1
MGGAVDCAVGGAAPPGACVPPCLHAGAAAKAMGFRLAARREAKTSRGRQACHCWKRGGRLE